jgi:ribulose-phosphate 3-epimerase
MITEASLSIPIEVDGGITTETIGIAAKAGAEIFVAGSAVYKKPDIAKAVSDLLDACENV